MMREIEAGAAARVLAAGDRILAAELPPGCTATRDGSDVAISGPRLLRRLAFDPRLRMLGRGGAT